MSGNFCSLHLEFVDSKGSWYFFTISQNSLYWDSLYQSLDVLQNELLLVISWSVKLTIKLQLMLKRQAKMKSTRQRGSKISKIAVYCWLPTQYPRMLTVSAHIRRQSWLNRHASTLFSKICQLLNVLFSKISP